jgi:hypothetical protein
MNSEEIYRLVAGDRVYAWTGDHKKQFGTYLSTSWDYGFHMLKIQFEDGLTEEVYPSSIECYRIMDEDIEDLKEQIQEIEATRKEIEDYKL